MKDLITASIVTYHNRSEIVQEAVNSFLRSKNSLKLYIIDNSRDNTLKGLFTDERCTYIKNDTNLGYGAAHNKGIKKAIELNSKYHLILNPDVFFGSDVLEKLTHFMDHNPGIGLVMPKVRYPNGDIQYLCKLLPTPSDLFLRRFSPSQKVLEKRNDKYELRFTGYNQQMEVPALSGCFMFIGTSVLKKIGGFDERFFMYSEDVDLCRRIGQISKTVYYPHAAITHNYEKGSYKSKKLLLFHIKSAIKYFNKWGWMLDKERRRINKETLKKAGYFT
jgi:GT2 family glycosyltransferase